MPMSCTCLGFRVGRGRGGGGGGSGGGSTLAFGLPQNRATMILTILYIGSWNCAYLHSTHKLGWDVTMEFPVSILVTIVESISVSSYNYLAQFL